MTRKSDSSFYALMRLCVQWKGFRCYFCLGTVSALRKQKDTDQGADKQHARIEQKRHNLEGGQFIAQLMNRR